MEGTICDFQFSAARLEPMRKRAPGPASLKNGQRGPAANLFQLDRFPVFRAFDSSDSLFGKEFLKDLPVGRIAVHKKDRPRARRQRLDESQKIALVGVG